MDATALAALIEREKQTLIAEWERGVRQLPSARDLHTPAVRDFIPGLIDEILISLRRSNRKTSEEIQAAVEHGRHRLLLGFDLREVAQEYKLLRQGIVQLAEDHGQPLTGQTARHIHDLLDDAVAIAIAAYIDQRDADDRKQRDERLHFLVHDLRSPLAAIYQAIEVVRLASGQDLSERSRAMVDAVQRNVRQLQAMTIKLLQAERNRGTPARQAALPWSVPLAKVADNAIGSLQPLVAYMNTTVVNRLPADLMVAADPELLERILQNLLTNAIEQRPDGTVWLDARPLADGMEVSIADNGTGVPDEIKKRIFEKHFTTRLHGTGLGLAIAKQFVSAHGGRIWVDDRPDGGAVFRFVLPNRTIDQNTIAR